MEGNREYVIQWPEHSSCISEKISDLLAKQSLVDVTLICDDHKLKVHKLVLASYSNYFEELFADLDKEPTILLKDLNFSVLKAMIEFMYCGETTVNHTYLPSLLTTARLFDVRELESIVEKILSSQTQDLNDNHEEYLPRSLDNTGRNGMKNNEIGIRVDVIKDCKLLHRTSDNEKVGCSNGENSSKTTTEQIEYENCLHEDSCSIINDKLECSKNLTVPSSVHNNENLLHNKNSAIYTSNEINHRADSLETVSDLSTLDSEHYEKDSDISSYRKCCDYVNTCTNDSKDDKDLLFSSPDSSDSEFSKIGPCSKVYSHKKRKIGSDNESLKQCAFLEKGLSIASSKEIDLTDEECSNKVPVTLKTNLNRVSSNYILSFNTENKDPRVGCALSEFCPLNTFDFLYISTISTSCIDSSDDSSEGEEEEANEGKVEIPVLRRSSRLNQQDNNEAGSSRRRKFSYTKRNQTTSKLLPRNKRKSKELERQLPNKVNGVLSNQNKKTHSKPLRKSTKFNGKHPKPQVPRHDKYFSKPKTSDKTNTVNVNKSQNEHRVVASNAPAIAISRALWGDMSDVKEGKVDDKFMEYVKNAEIPFAVGLLPLQAALERMQASLDHQPRKTRSSIGVQKPNFENGSLKRKGTPTQTEVAPKKQNIDDDANVDNQSEASPINVDQPENIPSSSLNLERSTDLNEVDSRDSNEDPDTPTNKECNNS